MRTVIALDTTPQPQTATGQSARELCVETPWESDPSIYLGLMFDDGTVGTVRLGPAEVRDLRRALKRARQTSREIGRRTPHALL